MSYCRIKNRLELITYGNAGELYFVKERRHTAQLLIIILRDFYKVLTEGKQIQVLAELMSSLW